MAKKLSDLDRAWPQVMAVLNVTPDSFSDGGSYFKGAKLDVGACRWRIEAMLEQGAALIDVGGESTRPGALPVSVSEEMDRVLPVLEILQAYDVVISLDSSKAEVIGAASRIGIGLVNDVRALRQGNALQVVAAAGLPVCLMHMQGEPGTMQGRPSYRNVLDEVEAFLRERVDACLAAGIPEENLLVDPGFGFGKTLVHNVELLAGLQVLQKMGLPILVGLSRKSMIGQMLSERDVSNRMAGSIALAVMAVERGAWIVRAHDVRETVDAVTIAAKIMRNEA